MFSMIRRRMTYANVVLTLALIFAMTGGAYAAKRYLIVSTKQISPSVLKALQGKTGPAGKEGPAGKNGANGNAGALGPQGLAGPEGKPGKEGKEGAEGEEGREGKQGKEGKEGKAGQQGVTGQPWTPNNVLPSGATETGAWAARPSEGQFAMADISFPVALAAELERAHVHLIPVDPKAEGTGNLTNGNPTVTGVTASTGEFKVGAGIEDITDPTAIPPGTKIEEVNAGEFTMSESAAAATTGDTLKAGNPQGCPANANAENPAAEAGNLCAYVGENLANDAKVTGPYKPYGVLQEGAGTAGAVLDVEAGPGPDLVVGAWAVTAK
jgi:hypothetical protein